MKEKVTINNVEYEVYARMSKRRNTEASKEEIDRDWETPTG